MIKIGITEAGDAGLDVSWANKMQSVSAAIIITKSITPLCSEKLIEHKDKCVLHATITGYGGTVLEPNVPCWREELSRIKALTNEGFPLEQVTVRVDPIIPTAKGIKTAHEVLSEAALIGFRRFRVSIIDMYPHVRERFRSANLPLPYGNSFSPPQRMVDDVDTMLAVFRSTYPFVSVESCAEKLTHADQVGCVSGKDLDILGIFHDDLDNSGYQRSGCLCCSCKTELLSHKCRCPNGCLYCYWK